MFKISENKSVSVYGAGTVGMCVQCHSNYRGFCNHSQ